ncbi:hypothetical protein BDF20DRAFT_889155 [Mycotypha africana]|uniref:uncharacterized protein n=1 Tax=Mycotypha africana TaxID=64632 RepID=UPI002300F492|nr:uncharacterized protein BDF20DRAFT_889155 [Mycotypha africana]KAI8970072.1 hypothetical protein BDF20DRAFT_889155 [Mycotypha africana]
MSNYFNRFYPLQAAKLFVKSLKNNNNTSALNSPTKVLKLTKDLTQNQSNAALVDAVKSIFIKFDTLPDQKQLDFTVSRRVSTILDAGYGVFLNGNTQKAGSILCFYPGTIYMSSDPIFFVSLSNQYILKCADGIYIDGKSNGLSGRVYSSLYKRENWPGAILVSDNTWMTATNDIKNLRNPLAIGQFVNNHTDECKANGCILRFVSVHF